jgi:hypothetical protein
MTKICKRGHEYEPMRSPTGHWITCKECRISNQQQRYYENPKKYVEKTISWQRVNKEKYNSKSRKWCKEHKEVYLAKWHKRMSALRSATPQWLSEEQKREMRRFHADAKELQWLSDPRDPLTVDHIIPLQSEDVCGLHVPWNLQILPRSQNSIKGNKWQ